ncbi:GNAT family N-acetyltransferase [Maribacter polysiphoniae]|uniref:Acetyltransferase (GNAT) family protein n=1 Tax=Maribacter polysiphoniae TaxID=429344 RepID=A0A316DTH4_9FLAO|nr:GNAT family N-acetyltransferase [Maribacter polysiphoniae]MBD1262700.1 GNAT family N-acetyltransferase [Maribacter polysiphoniae]PWK21096.1 acetyltransferase (GNAT) family protein [Maribacter polysiphoniae]
MISNPFTSDTFSTIWSKHFSPSVSATRFGFLKTLFFEKHQFLPLYINYGKTHTKGISYTIENSDVEEIVGKVVLIYDVPTYFTTAELPKNRIKRYQIQQYPGFLIDLESYRDVNEYMVGTFKKSSRYKLNKYKRKLESCFDINYKMFHGEISKDEYESIFASFNALLTKRFDEKQVTNNNLEKEEWDFYHEVAYPMILEKKAGLFVIYNGNLPIGVTLCYFSEEILFDAITVFDIDYSKFHLGSVTIMKLIAWCIEQKLKIFDFSKGYFDYKVRWGSKKYDFEYHILYDSKSLIAQVLALAIALFFKFKQFLRDKNVNEKLHRITYKLKNKPDKTIEKFRYTLFEITEDYQNEDFVEINYGTAENEFLKTIVFEFLYLKNESQRNLKLFRSSTHDNRFLFSGIDNKVMVEVV